MLVKMRVLRDGGVAVWYNSLVLNKGTILRESGYMRCSSLKQKDRTKRILAICAVAALNERAFMKRIMAICAVAALAGCASVGNARMENGKLVVDSPFDLEIGSTKYAKMLGDRLQSTTSANYDPRTKVTTTNWSWYASCRLSEQYWGCREVSLYFKGEERRLDNFRLECSARDTSLAWKMTPDECRQAVRGIAADVEGRLGLSMSTGHDSDNEEVAKMVEDMKKEHDAGKAGSRHGITVSRSFVHKTGHNDSANVGARITGMVGNDGKCWCSVEVYYSGITKEPEDPAAAKRRKAAHAAAAKLRKTIAKMFGVDLDAPVDGKKNDGADKENNAYRFSKEWSKLEKPCEGMTERKVMPSNSLLGFTVAGLSLRRAYEGDVSEDELKTVAAGFLARLESVYGGKLPPADVERGEKMLATLYGDGVPAFGDTNAALQLDRTRYFVGRVGDLAVEISYAVPQHAKNGDSFEIARRGGVLVNFIQMPLLAEEKTLAKKELLP